MDGENSTESPLDAAAVGAGTRAIEAFTLLGNEMRLSILLALWEAYEPWSSENAVAFSELRERVGRPDSGQFNYHLEKLRGTFVRKTDAGYQLSRAGERLVRTVVAGAGFEEPPLDRAELDSPCPLCGAPTVVSYTDGLLVDMCTECDGQYRYGSDYPEGTLGAVEFDPAGLSGRTPDEMVRAATVRFVWNLQAAIEGVCSACSGAMEPRLHVCPDHVEEGICPTCERRDRVMARVSCPVCKRNQATSPVGAVFYHPAVVSFLYDRGLSVMHDDEGVEARLRLAGDGSFDVAEELVSTDPPSVRVTIRYEGESLVVVVDDDLQVEVVEGPP